MGREFLEIFEDWADSYDSFVEGQDPQYEEVFRGYDRILSDIVAKCGNYVLEFGVGTGNLTRKLLDGGKIVFPIEPSPQMCDLAKAKLGSAVQIHDGDLLVFPLPPHRVDAIVSSYVFHHLNDSEKAEAARCYFGLLPMGGKVIFADTMFESEAVRRQAIEKAHTSGFADLKTDLEREYYPLVPDMARIFESAGFTVAFTQYNDFVWIMEATKAVGN